MAALEDSFLSKRVPHYRKELQCTQFEPNASVTWETLPDNLYFLRSTRTVAPAAGGQSKITYRIEFDKAVVKHGLGFSLPAFLVTYVTRKAMRQYLRQLQQVLENRKVAAP